jgi:hypothetical protein
LLTSTSIPPNRLDDLRAGWDQHVRFGLEHPLFYGLLYGRTEPGKPCAVTAPAHAALRERLTAAAAKAGSRCRRTTPPSPGERALLDELLDRLAR